MMEVTKDTRNRTGRNSVAGFELSYTIIQQTEQPASNASVSIERKNGERVGNVNAYRSGKFFLSITEEGTLSYDDIRLITDTIIDDVKSIFSE